MGREQDQKTPAAIREVDIAAPLPEMLRAFAEGRTGICFPPVRAVPSGTATSTGQLESWRKRRKPQTGREIEWLLTRSRTYNPPVNSLVRRSNLKNVATEMTTHGHAWTRKVTSNATLFDPSCAWRRSTQISIG
jgi:hypothetical protein